jgi:hypothetical protein
MRSINDLLTEEQILELVFDANIQPTGNVIKRIDPSGITFFPAPTDEPIKHTEHKEIAIKMPEDKYEDFISGFGKYVQMIHGIDKDPIAKEMFEKLFMYIELRR